MVDNGQLPVGWEIKTLGEVCKMINRGISPKYIDEGGICVINQKCIRNHTINGALARRHDLAAKSINPERYIQVGDVLINSTGTGTLGRVAQVRTKPNEITTVDTHVTIVRPYPNKFFDDFFGYMLVRIEDEIASSGEGASGQTELARNTIADKFRVSFPRSISEQKRIVAILDDAFEGCDRAIRNTEKNLANARELFESYLNSIFTPKGDGWAERKLEEISECVSVGHVGETSSFYCDENDGIPFVRSQNVRPRRLELDRVRYITKKFHAKLKKSRLICGDLLFVRVGVNRGDCCSVPANLGELNCANIVFARPREGLIDYLEYYCQSKTGRSQLMGMTTGSAQGVINTKSVAELLIPFPHINEQREISEKINCLTIETQRLEAIYRQKIAALKELKQSILQKAFTGELTADKEAA